MPQIFPKWSNTAAKLAPLCFVGGLCFAIFVVWYWFSPWNTDVGYEPVQPIPFSHKLHASDLGIDCLYCHNQAEKTPFAGVPSTETCMNCHEHQTNKDLLTLAPLMASWQSASSSSSSSASSASGGGIPIAWKRIHKVPDYAYFDHSAHIKVGVGCVSCHGQVNEMQVVRQTKPLSMAWCLNAIETQRLTFVPWRKLPT